MWREQHGALWHRTWFTFKVLYALFTKACKIDISIWCTNSLNNKIIIKLLDFCFVMDKSWQKNTKAHCFSEMPMCRCEAHEREFNFCSAVCLGTFWAMTYNAEYMSKLSLFLVPWNFLASKKHLSLDTFICKAVSSCLQCLKKQDKFNFLCLQRVQAVNLCLIGWCKTLNVTNR